MGRSPARPLFCGCTARADVGEKSASMEEISRPRLREVPVDGPTTQGSGCLRRLGGTFGESIDLASRCPPTSQHTDVYAGALPLRPPDVHARYRCEADLDPVGFISRQLQADRQPTVASSWSRTTGRTQCRPSSTHRRGCAIHSCRCDESTRSANPGNPMDLGARHIGGAPAGPCVRSSVQTLASSARLVEIWT